MSNLITIADLDRWGACGRDDQYDDATLTRWLKGREGLTPLEVANLRQVEPVDRLWVLVRKGVLGAKLYREFEYACADRAVRKYALRCPETREWAKRWLSPGRTTADEAWAARANAPESATWAARAAEVIWQLAWLRKRLREGGEDE